MTFSYKNDRYRFERLVALIATSRGGAFLSSFDGPARGQESEVQGALAELFVQIMEHGGNAFVSRADVAASLTGADVDGSDMIAWIDDLPDASGSRALSCVFYWSSVFMGPCAAEDRNGPPEIETSKWVSFRAAAEKRPGDIPEPDPLAVAAKAYHRAVAPLRSFCANVEDWQCGPFTDFDLLLAKRFEWDIAERALWGTWIEIAEYAMTKQLWRCFGPAFTQVERDAIFAWKVGHVAESRQLMREDPRFPNLAEDLLPDPPCHPDDMMRADT